MPKNQSPKAGRAGSRTKGGSVTLRFLVFGVLSLATMIPLLLFWAWPHSKALQNELDAVSDRKKLKRLVCYPKGVTLQDGKDAFIAWAAENSGNKKLMSEVPVVGLVRSLAGKYPCKG